MKYVDIAFAYPEVLETCHPELRRHFEPMIRATYELPEVSLFSGITLRLLRLVKAATLLCRAGLDEECKLPFRSATESIVNLLYIMHAGPATGPKSNSELAKQFAAYGDLAYAKLLRGDSVRARNVWKERAGLSDSEFDSFLQEREQLAADAASVHGCLNARWHNLNLVAMGQKVRENLPIFIERTQADQVFSSFVSANSATHADALSIRSQYKALGNAPLELVFKANSIHADIVGLEGLWAWQVIADYYDQMDFVKKCITQHLRVLIENRIKSSPNQSAGIAKI